MPKHSLDILIFFHWIGEHYCKYGQIHDMVVSMSAVDIFHSSFVHDSFWYLSLCSKFALTYLLSCFIIVYFQCSPVDKSFFFTKAIKCTPDVDCKAG